MAIKEGNCYLNLVVSQEVKDAIKAIAEEEGSTVSKIGARIISKSEEVKKFVEAKKQAD